MVVLSGVLDRDLFSQSDAEQFLEKGPVLVYVSPHEAYSWYTVYPSASQDLNSGEGQAPPTEDKSSQSS